MKPIRKFRECAVVLVGMMAISCWTRSVRADTEVYVSVSTGSDETRDGSQSNPWATIEKALASVTGNPGDSYLVLVAEGTYYESILIPGYYESVFGGYNPADWERDIETYRTVVDGGGSDRYVFKGKDLCTFDGLYIQNADQGINCADGSPTISRCHISNCDEGIYTKRGAVIRRNILQGNRVGISGHNNIGFTTTIENNLIILNSLGQPVPSGIYSVSNNMKCINNTIDSNGNGIRILKLLDGSSPEVLIQNNNITQNGGLSYYNGIYLSDSEYFGVDPEKITIRYNNVWGNETNYDGCSPGEGDISQNPLYRAPSAVVGSYERLQMTEIFAREEDLLLEMEAEEQRTWERGYSVTAARPSLRRGGERLAAADYDYQLLENSPSIDAGTNENAPSEDMLGALRPNPSTAIADIGCYEYYSTPAPTPPAAPWITDYNGDGTSDIAVFRPTNGLWIVRQVTRAYFGSSSDLPVPADYTGDGTTDIAIFRESNGLWSVSGGQRYYFGGAGDLPFPGDYSGDGTAEPGVFRNGLWIVKGVTRAYFGSSGDSPVPGYWAGDGNKSIGIFRPANGLWIIRGITRAYFGSSGDRPVPGDYSGAGGWDLGVFRPTNGLWIIRGITRAYFGSSTDLPIPGGYRGDGQDYPGIFRNTNGLWVIKGVTRVYFGSSSDQPVVR